MNIDVINMCMNVLECLEDDAPSFFRETVKRHKVTEDGPWCQVKLFNDMCTKYLKTDTIACGAGALAASAEYTGASKGISANIYLRSWVLTADSKNALVAYFNLGSLGSKYATTVKNYIKAGSSKILEDCDYKKMSVDNAFALIEYLDPEDTAQNRLMEYIADADEELLMLARYIRYRGGTELNAIPAI